MHRRLEIDRTVKACSSGANLPKIALSQDDRAKVVQIATQLLAELQLTNGDSPDVAMRQRRRLMRRLRTLGIILWRDAISDEETSL